MVRLADMGMTVLQEVFTPGFLESEGVACHTRPHGEASGSIRRQRSQKRKKLYIKRNRSKNTAEYLHEISEARGQWKEFFNILN